MLKLIYWLLLKYPKNYQEKRSYPQTNSGPRISEQSFSSYQKWTTAAGTYDIKFFDVIAITIFYSLSRLSLAKFNEKKQEGVTNV